MKAFTDGLHSVVGRRKSANLSNRWFARTLLTQLESAYGEWLWTKRVETEALEWAEGNGGRRSG